MFKSFEELIRFKRSRFQIWREAMLHRISGIVLAAAGFQAIYSVILAFD
jgi:hypothetical protein